MQACNRLIPRPANCPVWHDDAPARAALTSPLVADVAIVGAGYTGLWTAYYLLRAQPSLRVVVLEREQVGFGASGRNGGWASAIFPVSLQRVAQTYTHEAALHLQAAMNETVDEIGRVLETEGLDADYDKQGFVSLARNPAQLRRIHASVAAAQRFGLPAQWQSWSASQAQEKIAATDVLGALYTPYCAVLHPGKLVRALAAAVERLGGVIVEKTPVVQILPGRVFTPGGEVRAETVVNATEAFASQQLASRRRVIPLYSMVLATAPLPAELRQRLNLTQRLAFNDMRHLRVYGQLTRDARLVFGGRGAPYRLGSRLADGGAHRIHRALHAALLDFFPDLSGVAVTHRWGGALGVARDWFPAVCLDARRRIAWAGSYVGDGVATSNLAGRLLRNLILNQDEAINRLPLVNHASPDWEREPLRWLGVNAGLRLAALGDREERWTRRPSRIARVLEALTGAH